MTVFGLSFLGTGRVLFVPEVPISLDLPPEGGPRINHFINLIFAIAHTNRQFKATKNVIFGIPHLHIYSIQPPYDPSLNSHGKLQY